MKAGVADLRFIFKRQKRLTNGLLCWGPPLVASLILTLAFLPAELWRHPVDDAVYEGFDPNLIYADAAFPSAVQATRRSLGLTALPGSQSVMHLVTSPLSFTVAMDVRVMESRENTTPVRAAVWSPRTESGVFWTFGPPPSYVITMQIAKGIDPRTLVNGKLNKAFILGKYEPGKFYHLESFVDRASGAIGVSIATTVAPPSGNPMLRLPGGPSNPHYSDVMSNAFRVNPGQEYDFGATVKCLTESATYKISLFWYDRQGRYAGFWGDWRSAQELNGWTKRTLFAKAPAEAASARLFIGAGDDTEIHFADLFVRPVRGSKVNLLPDGALQQESRDWHYFNDASRTPEIVEARNSTWKSHLTMASMPELFPPHRLPLSFSVSTSSQGGLARIELANYRVTLPHQRWQAVKIDDVRVRRVLIVLLLSGALLAGGNAILWIRRRRLPRQLRQMATSTIGFLRAPLTVPHAASIILALIGGAAVLLLNALLFSLGSLPFDMYGEKIWSYVATQYGLPDLYYLPDTVSLAKVWGGIPYHEAIFPYGPVMAYIFAILGWCYRLFLNGPSAIAMDTFQLEFIIKMCNVLFAALDALLIFFVLRNLGTGLKRSLIASAFFGLNPAIWFSASIWGQTQTVSMSLVLASMWAAEKDRPLWAWLTLIAATLTRIQMLVPSFILGLFYLRRFPLKRNIYALSWSIIALALLLTPFVLTISPSLPIDNLVSSFLLQVAGKNEPALTTVSLDAYSLWPLVARFIHGATSTARFAYPAGSALIGPLSYGQTSTLLTVAVVTGAAFLLLTRRGAAAGSYLPVLALATIGFLMLKTGLAAAHFVIGLPFLILLCANSTSNAMRYILVGVWTFTTAASMYGSFVYGVKDVPDLAPALSSTNNSFSQFVMRLHSTDWFVTLGALGNLLVLAWISYIAVSHWQRSRQQG